MPLSAGTKLGPYEIVESIGKGGMGEAAIHPQSPYNIGLLAGVLRNAGETAQSEALLERLPTGATGASVALACFHLVRGEFDSAVQYTGVALDEGYPLALFMFVLPFERFLRQSTGWRPLMRKLNLPESR